MTAQVEQQDDGKFSVVDQNTRDVMEKDIETEDQARAIAAEYQADDEIGEEEAEDEKQEAEAGAEPASEHNPHGLEVHQRLHQLLQTLKKHGIYHSEVAHPAHNPLTTADNYAKPQHS